MRDRSIPPRLDKFRVGKRLVFSQYLCSIGAADVSWNRGPTFFFHRSYEWPRLIAFGPRQDDGKFAAPIEIHGLPAQGDPQYMGRAALPSADGLVVAHGDPQGGRLNVFRASGLTAS